MILQHLSWLWFLIGLGILAAGLFALQRLRVRHRDVTVITTLFWQDAIDEQRARVRTRAFRHPWAYALLLALAALIWFALAGPHRDGATAERHIVLIDASAALVADDHFALISEAARSRVADLPRHNTDVWLVGATIMPVLRAGEVLPLLETRLATCAADQAPNMLGRTLSALDRLTDDDTTVHAHVISPQIPEMQTDRVHVHHVAVEGIDAQPRAVQALGVANASSGRWTTVDVLCVTHIAVSNDAAPVWTLDDSVLQLDTERIDDNTWCVRDVPARGGTLTCSIDTGDASVRTAVTLPDRTPINVFIEPETPDAVRRLLTLDDAVRIVGAPSDDAVRVGPSVDAQFRMTTRSADIPAFAIGRADNDVSRQHHTALIDALAIRQIDAQQMAEQAQAVIRLDLHDAPHRSVAVWSELFGPAYDFRDGRACPLFVAGAIRWLARRPPLLPWAIAGERLPAFSPAEPALPLIAGSHVLADGRTVDVMLPADARSSATDALSVSDAPSWSGQWPRMATWLLCLAFVLCCIEWVLFQRGRMP